MEDDTTQQIELALSSVKMMVTSIQHITKVMDESEKVSRELGESREQRKVRVFAAGSHALSDIFIDFVDMFRATSTENREQPVNDEEESYIRGMIMQMMLTLYTFIQTVMLPAYNARPIPVPPSGMIEEVPKNYLEYHGDDIPENE